jgi:4'-phosphopantetheinyl transferase
LPPAEPAQAVVQLRYWPIEHATEADRRLLSPAERERADRLVQPAHRIAFIAARAGLRRVLGALAGDDPADLDLRIAPGGKPWLAGVDPPLQFSLSHAGGLAAVAVAGFPLGLDIERLRPIDLALADRFFAAAEAAELARLPPAVRERGFFQAWTRKEAYLKATGTGLAAALDGFVVSLAPGAPPALLEVRGDAAEAAGWQLVHLELPPSHLGAVAARHLGWRLIVQPE